MYTKIHGMLSIYILRPWKFQNFAEHVIEVAVTSVIFQHSSILWLEIFLIIFRYIQI